MIKINGKLLPNPTKYKASFSDLDSSDSTRNELGVLTRNRIRAGVVKLELGFTLKGSEVQAILDSVQPAKVSVEYTDTFQAAPKTIQAYVGDRSCELKKKTSEGHPEEDLWEVSFNLIEY